MPHTAIAAPLLLTLTAGLTASLAAAEPTIEWVYHCMPRDPDAGDLRLVGGRFPVEVDRSTDHPTPLRVGAARFVEGLGWIDENAPARAPNPANRLDIVFVGDGYTAAQLGTYAAQVTSFADAMFQDEPFATYRPLFAIHRVDVASPESGVDNDPSLGISRNTAMNMAFWCNNIERLLCVDVGLAYAYANTAAIPDGNGPDQVIALANSSKYGGAGYSSSDLGTASAGNGAAVEVVVHELGHSLGNLADEYDYGGPANYSGGEPNAANVSTYTPTQMSDRLAKWYRWLGVNNPAFDGLHNSFEGGQYSQFGIYRPTNNSKMRALGRPFNLVNAEGLIKEIYRVVDPIDDASPSTTGTVAAHTTLAVTPVQPVGHQLDVEWFFNGQPIAGATATTLDTCAAGIAGVGVITVTVTDNTPWVRDETFRAQNMRSSRSWAVSIPYQTADVNRNGLLDPGDFTAWVTAYNAQDPIADQNGDGAVSPGDFTAWINNYNAAGCD
ncbi:MAG: M64 family metallopeptidase [Phycisphaerales bacterium]